MKPLDYFRKLAAMAQFYRRHLLVMVVLGLLAALSEGVGLSLFVPLFYSLGGNGMPAMPGDFFAKLAGIFEPIEPAHRLTVITASIFGLVVVKNVFQYANKVFQAWLEARLVKTFRSQIADAYLTAPWKKMQAEEMGTLVNTLDWVTRDVASAIVMAATCLIYLGTISILAVFLLLISWKLMLLVTLSLSIISILIYFLTRRVEKVAHDAIRADENFAQRALQMLLGLRTIRLFNLESREKQGLESSAEVVAKLHFVKRSIGAVIHPISELLVGGLIIAVLFQAANGAHTLPALMTFIFILYRMHPPIKMLDEARTEVIKFLPALQTVIEVVGDRALQKPIEPPAAAKRASSPSIEFRNVWFRYDETGPSILRGASLRIEPESVTAIVGPSGAGKSTLVHLLTRFYEPASGDILIDGRPLDTLPIPTWRRQIGLVAHDAHLFNTSIAENIRCGRPDAPHADVVEAARLAHAHDFITHLPDGYATGVDELGARLSAGQRQRIALARAILRDPSLLILDEATNALDSISDDFVHQTLQHLRKNRTILLIAHRLSTMRQADRILVVNDGVVVESGTFDELLIHGGLFNRLFELQHISRPTIQLTEAS